nr:transposase [Sphingomonas desiccabilis]
MVCRWRAVDHEGEALESFVTRTRDKADLLSETPFLPSVHLPLRRDRPWRVTFRGGTLQICEKM